MRNLTRAQRWWFKKKTREQSVKAWRALHRARTSNDPKKQLKQLTRSDPELERYVEALEGLAEVFPVLLKATCTPNQWELVQSQLPDGQPSLF